MRPLISLARFARWQISRVAILPFISGLLLAQTDRGTIAGRVYDEATGRSLPGAIVRITGSPSVDYTDAEGRYTLAGLPPGPVRIEFEYVGLESRSEITTVTAGTSTLLNAGLKSEILRMEAYQVAETARGQALAINQQRTASGIVNIVSEEIFGNMLSGNIGYALQRLPGISVDEDQDGSPGEINLRGVPGELNSVQIDGIRIPNSGGTSRAADAKQLMADGATNIEVIKAVTPDRDGDAIGGIINIVSRGAFQRDSREVRLVATGTYNDLSGEWGYNGRLTYSDIFSVFGQRKNLGLSVTLTQHKTDRYSENADIDWVVVTKANNPQLNLSQDTKFLEASHSERSFRTTHTTGVNASIDFRTDKHNSFYFRPYFSHYDQNSRTFETDWDIDTRFQDQVGGRKTYAFLSSDGSRGRGTAGTNGSRATLGYIGTDSDSHNDLWTWTLGGRHERNSSTLTYDFNYSTSTYVRPKFVEFNFILTPATQGYYVMEYEASNRLRPVFTITNNLSPTDFALARQGQTNLIIQPRTKEEEITTARIDWERKFIGQRMANVLKVGGKHRSSRPTFDQEDARYRIAANSAAAAAFPFASVTEPASGVVLGFPRYLYALPNKALDTLHTSGWQPLEPNSFQGSTNADYRARESTTAAYVQDTIKFGRHTVVGGMRMEHTAWSRNNQRAVYTLPGPVYGIEYISKSYQYDVWLPGLHFRHALAPNLILRESYNKSYGRPNLSAITRGRNESVAVDGTITITDGNPDLKPSESDNFDLQLEYYTASQGLYSVSIFHKRITNFTYTKLTRFDELDANDLPISAVSGRHSYSRPVNGPGARNTGIELIARQRLSFLPGPLKGFSADVSATFTESDATVVGRENEKLPMRGFSKYLFTSSLVYAWRNFRARVDYRYRADYIEGLAASAPEDEWFSAREQVDAEVSYRIRKGVSVSVTGTNLTHRPQVSYTGERHWPEDVSYSGRKYSCGIEYRF